MREKLNNPIYLQNINVFTFYVKSKSPQNIPYTPPPGSQAPGTSNAARGGVGDILGTFRFYIKRKNIYVCR